MTWTIYPTSRPTDVLRKNGLGAKIVVENGIGELWVNEHLWLSLKCRGRLRNLMELGDALSGIDLSKVSISQDWRIHEKESYPPRTIYEDGHGAKIIHRGHGWYELWVRRRRWFSGVPFDTKNLRKIVEVLQGRT